MNLKFARNIKNFCYIASSILALATFLLPEQRTIFLIAAVVVVAIGIVVSFAFYRCPHCKTPLPANEKLPKKCPHCGLALMR